MSHASELIATDIEAYLKQHENKDLLRFLTCGNVDDGKSTLIGRLLFDSKLIFEDHLSALQKDNERVGNAGDNLDLALLVDGLQSEREQGITIDVAYRYFSTDKRKFIIADCPGHEQYTRNMATGASNCELAIVMVDARRGVQTQTRRHSFICSLLGIKHIIVAVNKMDLVDYSQDVYQQIKSDYKSFADDLGFTDLRFVPISALEGDNVVSLSDKMDWYPGAPLMKLLETVRVAADKDLQHFRFPVQYVNRPNLDFRGFCGTVGSGVVSVGDEIVALPSCKRSKVKSIVTYEGEQQDAYPGEAITITLEDEIDISRGDLLVKPNDLATIGNQFTADLVWMAEQPMELGREYHIKFAAKMTSGVVAEINHETDVNTLEKIQSSRLELNSIGNCVIKLSENVALDTYSQFPKTGAFVIIDRLTNGTVGAGMIRSFKAQDKDAVSELDGSRYNAFEKDLNALIRKHYPEWECKAI